MHLLRTAGLLVLGGLTLTACSGKNDANEKNFGTAISKYLEAKGALCLNARRWPVDVSEMDLRLQGSMPSGPAKQMAALEAAGLARGEDMEIEPTPGLKLGGSAFKTKVRRYSLTEAAKPFARARQADSIGLNGRTSEKQVDLCWGQKALDKVVKWEGPMKLGDYQEATVSYVYKVDKPAAWAQRPDIQAAFPAVKAALDAAGTKPVKHAVKLTSEGWEARGMD
jgi:hypothetical protein